METDYIPMKDASRLRWLAGGAAIIAAPLGLCVLAAWGLGQRWVAPFGMDSASLAPVTGIFFVLATLAAVCAWQLRQAVFLRQALAAEKVRNTLIEGLAFSTQQANDVILVLDDTMRIVQANDRGFAFYGRTPAEMQQLTVQDLRTVEAAGTLLTDYAAALKPDGLVIETTHRRKDGTVFPVEVSARLAEADGRRYILSIVRDITARKQTEQANAHNEARLRRAEQVAGIGNWAIHVATGEVTASANARRIYGLGEGKLTLSEIQSVPLPEYRAMLDSALHDLTESKSGGAPMGRLLPSDPLPSLIRLPGRCLG